MKLSQLRRIQKFYFGYEELGRALEISPASARVAASRYVQQGLLVRIKRNIYMLRETWQAAGKIPRHPGQACSGPEPGVFSSSDPNHLTT